MESLAMMASTASSIRARGIPLFVSLAALALLLALTVYLRRSPVEIEELYHATNVMNNHEPAVLSMPRFGRLVAGLQFLAIAALVALIARGRRAWALTGSLAFAFTVVYVDSVSMQVTRVAGRLYFMLCDDAFISMRYARNFASGLGLVYNAGERVEGYTNPLWTLMMAVPLKAGMHEGTAPAVVLVVGGLLLLATGLMVREVLDKRGVASWVQACVLVALLWESSLFEYAVLGLETPAIGAAATLVFASMLLGRPLRRDLGLAVLPTIRPDGAIIGALLIGWAMLEDHRAERRPIVELGRRHLRPIAVLGAAVVAMLVWHLALYGEAAPNTYYLKIFSLKARILAGVASYGFRGIFYWGASVLFVLWATHGARASKEPRRMLLPVVAMWLYGVFVGGDAFPHLRFLGPISPLLWTSVALAAHTRYAEWSPFTRAAALGILLFVAPTHSESGVLGKTWRAETWQHQNLLVAKTIEKEVPRDALIGIFYAGTVPYYAPNHRFLDLLGKAERTIAHQATIHGVVPGHNKFDFAYAYDVRKPDVTFSSMNCDEVEGFLKKPDAEQRALAAGLRPSHYQAPLYQPLDPTFRELYVPNRVVARLGDAPAGHPIGCLYVRKGSNVPIVWHLTETD